MTTGAELPAPGWRRRPEPLATGTTPTATHYLQDRPLRSSNG